MNRPINYSILITSLGEIQSLKMIQNHFQKIIAVYVHVCILRAVSL